MPGSRSGPRREAVRVHAHRARLCVRVLSIARGFQERRGSLAALLQSVLNARRRIDDMASRDWMARATNRRQPAPARPQRERHFGPFGGRYVAETLMPLLLKLGRGL